MPMAYSCIVPKLLFHVLTFLTALGNMWKARTEFRVQKLPVKILKGRYPSFSTGHHIIWPIKLTNCNCIRASNRYWGVYKRFSIHLSQLLRACYIRILILELQSDNREIRRTGVNKLFCFNASEICCRKLEVEFRYASFSHMWSETF